MSSIERLFESFQDQNRGRKILVNSGAKAGTTWMRTMICSLPGYEPVIVDKVHTPDLLCELRPYQVWHGHLGYSANLMNVLNTNDIRTVFVYRDLRDVIISNYFHLHELNPKRAPEGFLEKDIDELLRPEVLPTWCAPVKHFALLPQWLNEKSVVNVRYEDLKVSPIEEMTRVFSELGLSVSTELVEWIVHECSFEKQSGREPGNEVSNAPLRKGIIGDWKNYFSKSLARQFDEVYGDLLKAGGYELSFSSHETRLKAKKPSSIKSILQKPIQREIEFKKSDCTKLELSALYQIAKHDYQGRGAIVDLGCGIGGSTHAFCAGLKSNSQVSDKDKQIVAIDCFEFGDSGRGGHCNLRDFRNAISKYDEFVEIYSGDFKEFTWSNGDVEILFVDIAKTLELFRHTASTFYSHLIPGESVLVHQDFGRPRLPWLHYTTIAMLQYLGDIELVDDTLVARVTKKIDPQLLSKIVRDDFSIEEKVELIEIAREMFSSKQSYGCSYDEILTFSKAHVYFYAGKTGSVIEILRKTQWSDRFYDRFKIMFQQVMSGSGSSFQEGEVYPC